MGSKGLAIIILLGLLVIIVNAGPSAGTLVNWLKKVGYVEFPEYKFPPGYLNEGTPDTQPAPKDFNYQYQLIDTTPNYGRPYEGINYNAKLIKFYGDGRTEVVIESLRNRFGNILNQPNQYLLQYYFPPNSNNIYFNFKTPYTVGISSRYHIYRYSVKEDIMRDLYANKYLTNYVVPSPSNPNLMAAVDDDITRTYQRLYLINLENDNASLLVQVRNDETLAIEPIVSGKTQSADLSWVSSNRIIYGVYRSAAGSATNQFLEKRVISF